MSFRDTGLDRGRPLWLGVAALLATACGVSELDDGAAAGADAGSAVCPAFAPAATYAAGGPVGALAVVDVNGDGQPDVVAALSSGSVVLMLNGGNGVLAAPVATAWDAGYPVAVVPMVLGRSATPQLAVVGSTAQAGVAALFSAEGGGALMAMGTYSMAGLDVGLTVIAKAAVVGDFNGDGEPDLLVMQLGSASLFLGQIDGTLSRQAPIDTQNDTQSAVAADLDGDGLLDLALGDGLGDVDVFLGRGDGTFAAPAVTTNVRCQAAPLAVIESSAGLPDLAVGCNVGFGGDGSVLEYLNQGLGAFAPLSTSETLTGSPAAVATGDFNGGGLVDLAVAIGSSFGGPTGVGVLLNQGSGFAPAVDFPISGANPVAIATGDLNGDGLPDIVIANGDETGTISVLLNACGT